RHESLPGSAALLKRDVQAAMIKEVAAAYKPVQQELEGISKPLDIKSIVARTTELVVGQTIDIPRILVVPKGAVTVGFKPFKLDLSGINYQPVTRDLLIQHLRTRQQDTLSALNAQYREQRLEDYIVRALVDFDDISYDDHAELLYDLAGQVTRHLQGYLSEDDTRNVLQYHERQIAEFIHVQMQPHYWEKAAGYEVVVTKGFTTLKSSAFTAVAADKVQDLHQAVADKGKMGQLVFGGFNRCLYPFQKFQSDAERKMAIILEREALKWFKPAKGQFQLFYKLGAKQSEYQPDFVAETKDKIFMLEPKAKNELTSDEVLAKKAAALRWCELATAHSK
ncbi:MAG: type III restriction endonuclease subunit R, partial [Gammaproteobacteria bacterium]